MPLRLNASTQPVSTLNVSSMHLNTSSFHTPTTHEPSINAPHDPHAHTQRMNRSIHAFTCTQFTCHVITHNTQGFSTRLHLYLHVHTCIYRGISTVSDTRVSAPYTRVRATRRHVLGVPYVQVRGSTRRRVRGTRRHCIRRRSRTHYSHACNAPICPGRIPRLRVSVAALRVGRSVCSIPGCVWYFEGSIEFNQRKGRT